MKQLLRSRIIQAILGWLVAGYVEFLIRTLRWQIDNPQSVERAVGGSDGVIVLFWHGRIAHAMAARPLLREKPRRVMISLSADGAFIARAAERLRIPTIRGSTGRKDAANAKGGAGAFREALNFIREGGLMIITADGPRGPRHIMAAGPVTMARAAECPVFVMGLAAEPAVSLESWDDGRLPWPFARAAVVVRGPMHAPKGDRDERSEAIRTDWEAALNDAQTLAAAALVARSR